MSKYIKVKLPAMELSKPDITIDVHDDNGKIGTLTVSKGFIEWSSRMKKKGYRRINWKVFDNLMERYANGEL